MWTETPVNAVQLDMYWLRTYLGKLHRAITYTVGQVTATAGYNLLG